MLIVGSKIILIILLSVYKSPNSPTVSQGACSMSSAMSQCSQCHPLVPRPCGLRPLFCSFRKSHGPFIVVHRFTTSSSMFPLLNADPATTAIQSHSQSVTLTGMACSFCTNRTHSFTPVSSEWITPWNCPWYESAFNQYHHPTEIHLSLSGKACGVIYF
jgi:hypothetical protein